MTNSAGETSKPRKPKAGEIVQFRNQPDEVERNRCWRVRGMCVWRVFLEAPKAHGNGFWEVDMSLREFRAQGPAWLSD